MGNERIQHVDADTGAKILQLTSFPNLHWLMGPTPDAITPDGSALLLQANSAPVRNAGRDLWRVNADGSDLEPALEGAGGGVITTDGRWIVTSHPRGDGTALVRIPLAGGGAEEIAGDPVRRGHGPESGEPGVLELPRRVGADGGSGREGAVADRHVPRRQARRSWPVRRARRAASADELLRTVAPG